jgi:NAD(P)-dependent dehydrogenase (short-subunit alcohol dehydrogenase family)
LQVFAVLWDALTASSHSSPAAHAVTWRSHALRLAEEGADIIALDLCRQIDTVPYPMADSRDLLNTVEQVTERGRRVFAAEVDACDLNGLPNATNVNTLMINNPRYNRLFAGGKAGATQADALDALTAMHALPVPFLDPIDVSNAVVYLASDDGRFVTGTAHVIDAGALNPFKAPHLEHQQV